MALSNKENNTSVESGNKPPTHNTTLTTYANIAKKSLSNDNIKERVHHSKLWITSRTKGALLFDVSSLSDSLSHQWFMKEIKNQTDAVFGVRFVVSGYFILYINTVSAP
ncbi:unnamed protein product [Cunninghamella echinulata]